MNCKKCGNILKEGETVCSICGEPVTISASGVLGNNATIAPTQPIQQPVTQDGMVQQQVMPTNVAPTPVATVPTPQMEQQPVEQQASSPQPMSQPTMQNVVPTPVPVAPTPESVGMPTPMGQNNFGGMPNPNTPMGQGMPLGGPMPNPNQPQPMNMSQPMMGQPMNNQPAPKKNNLFIIIIIILGVVILALGGFIGYKVISNSSSSKQEQSKVDKKDTNKKDEDEDKDKDKEDDKDDDEVISEGNVFESSGYKFIIPKDIKYIVEDGMLTISDEVNFQSTFGVEYMAYDSEILSGINEIIEEFKGSGIEITSNKEKQVGNRKFLLMQFTYSGNVGVIYFSPLDEYTSVSGIIVSKTSSGYDKALEYIGSIADSSSSTSSFVVEAPTNTEKSLSLDKYLISDIGIEGVEYPLQ